MGTLEADIERYLRKSKGHFDRDEILEALAELIRAGGQVAAAATMLAGLGTIGFAANGIATGLGLRVDFQIARSMHMIWEKWGQLDTEQRKAFVKVAAWLLKRQYGY